jgi:hypothetical protein
MASIAEANSLFEIDMELDMLLEQIELQIESEGQPSEESVARFQQFCEARGEKVDRIGRFVRMMEAREQFCRNEATRLGDRARAAATKVERTKNMALYYLLSRDLKKVEGQQFTLRAQKNSQDSVRITDESALPKLLLQDRGAGSWCHLGDGALPLAGRTCQEARIWHPGVPTRQRRDQDGSGAERDSLGSGGTQGNAPSGRLKGKRKLELEGRGFISMVWSTLRLLPQ